MKILVVEDLTHTRDRTVSLLIEKYRDSEIEEAKTLEEALACVNNLVWDLLVLDLGLPAAVGQKSRLKNGLHLLKLLLEKHPEMNIAVQSAEPQALIRLKKQIDSHQGGFIIIDKTLSVEEMMLRIEWASQGLVHTRDIKGLISGIELKPEWLDTLRLASREHSLQDKEIAHHLHVTEPTVRHYWKKIQDALEIYPDTYGKRKNLRVHTLECAREAGLID